MKSINYKGLSLIEIIFALTIVCFLLSVAVFQFVGTKRIHYTSNEYLNKACLADIAVKLIKDQLQVNPYFLKNINNAVVKNSDGVYFINKDENLSDAIGGKDYAFSVTDFPVIAYSKNSSDKKCYYFGLFKVENIGALLSQEDKPGVSKAFLNVEDLQKYSFDLSIADESENSLHGILKNIDIKIKYGGPSDEHPFLLSTKVMCPQESLSSEVYSEFQEKLFENSRREFVRNMKDLLNGSETAILNNVDAVFDWLCSKVPPPLMFNYYALNAKKLEPEYKKKAEEFFRSVYFIIYVFDFNNCLQSEWADAIAEAAADSNVSAAVKLMNIISIYRKKAQLALQTADQIQIPLGEVCDFLQKGTQDTVSVMLASFLGNRYDEFLDYKDKSMMDIIRLEVKQLPAHFTFGGIKGALEKLNDLTAKTYDTAAPRELHGLVKEMSAFNEVNQITAHIPQSGYVNTEFKNTQDNIKLIEARRYGPDKFEAGSAYLRSELAKNDLIDDLINSKYRVVANKIKYFWEINRILTNLDSTLEVMTLAINMNISGNLKALLSNEDIMFNLEFNRDLAVASNDGVSRDEFLRKKYGISEEEYNMLRARYGDGLNAGKINEYVGQRDR